MPGFLDHFRHRCFNPQKANKSPQKRSRVAANVVTISALVGLCCFSVGQSQTPQNRTPPTFKSEVKIVLVDVVVTDHNGQPIKGLPKDSFEIRENGKRQTIASFEEYKGDATPSFVPRAPLPVHIYSNAPVAEQPGSVNLLLLDGLNTEPGDQANVRGEIISYLKRVEPGPRMAIFTLGSRLSMLQGFTDDPNVLLSAVSQTGFAGNSRIPMLQRPEEAHGLEKLLRQMSERPMGAAGSMAPAGSIAPAGMIEDLRNFLAEMTATETATRIWLTLQALQELSRYLTGFHGRKNIIWFSGSFPPIDFPAWGNRSRVDPNGTALSREMKETINMLAAGQIAVYPVAAQGLETQGIYQAQSFSPLGSGTDLREKMITGQSEALRKESVTRYTNQKAADDIASNTGGMAFYNTNGLANALSEVVRKGAYYYRLSYYPTDKEMKGRYRRIQVKVKKGHYASPSGVYHRHGYFEGDEKHNKGREPAPANHLQPLMWAGLPDSTELIYNLRLLRSGMKPTPGSPTAGDNRDLHGPTTRFSADFIVPIDSLAFEITRDGVRHGNVELALVAYDRAGNPLNWLFRSITTTLKAEVYPVLQKTGAQFHHEIDVPDGENYLRAGIYDQRSNKSGTFQVALRQVTAEENVTATTESLGASPQVQATLSRPSAMGDARASGVPAAPQTPSFKVTPQDNANPAVWQVLASRPSAQTITEALPSDVPQHCAALAGSIDHADALAKLCEFAFYTHKKSPDVICKRQTKRYRDTRTNAERMLNKLAKGGAASKNYFDVLTANVAYVSGREYYDDVRMDGRPVDAAAPWRAGTWTIGEFSTILVSIFLPSSKPNFRFQKQEVVGSVPALVFDFHVAARNNKSYFLSSSDRIWFPEYFGKLWLDRNTFQLLRLQRETPYMPHYPIRRARTDIDYSRIRLALDTDLVLPSKATALVCSQASDYCGVNVMSFAEWQMFRATTRILHGPVD